MSKLIKVAASILCADFTKLGDEIKKCEDAGVDLIHVDVMDGHFVPNITIGQVMVEAIRPITQLPIEVHLMIEHPSDYVESFADSGSDIISVHVECYGERREASQKYGQYPKEIDELDTERITEDLQKIRKKGKQAFAVINPGTPLCIQSILDELDGVLIMSVNPGFAKQKFIDEVLEKVEQLRENFEGDIAIDGGVNQETAPKAVKAGVNVLATASYFFGSKDPTAVVKYLKDL